VHALYDAGDGALWVGAESGLLRFDRATRTFTRRYTRRDGLPANSVVSLMADESRRLWLGTSAGLSRFDPARGVFRNYGRADGLPSPQFTWRACAHTGDGRLLFGGVGGFSIFDPQRLAENLHVPPIVLTGFELFNRPVSPGKAGSPLRAAIDATDAITLAHDQSVFRIQFAALDYAAPENNQYSWKMEGFDADWSQPAAGRRQATYTNLDPGRYVFRVRGSNNHGRWNEAGRVLRLTITPPWWSAPWLKAAGGVAGFALLFAFHRLRLRTIEERERRFRTLAESAPDIVARFDRERRCRYVNPAVESFTGRPAASFIDRTPAEMGLAGVDAARWEEPMRRVLESGAPVVEEIAIAAPGGVRWLEARLVPEPGADGRPQSVVVITRDVTARKQSEDRMRSSLEEKVLLLKEIHHRVKNNLQVICSLLNLQAQSADPGARELLQQSHNRVRTMALIHEKLYESGDLARVEAVPYLRTLTTAALYAYDVSQERIAAAVEGDPIALDADTAIPLGLLVNELVTNAVKHAFPGGRGGTIAVTLRGEDGGRLHLQVRDDGVGLPPGGAGERAGGLGLQLVEALVEQLSGTLEVAREAGTRFDIRFDVVRYRPRL
jgi:PAS domain S-box-containing protein